MSLRTALGPVPYCMKLPAFVSRYNPRRQSTMTSPMIPLQWILEYAVTDPSKFKDSFILGTSSRLTLSENSVMRPTCLNTRPTSNSANCPHRPYTPHLLGTKLERSLRRRQQHPGNN